MTEQSDERSLPWLLTSRGLDYAKESFGITEEHLSAWKDCSVLEVGVGHGELLYELIQEYGFTNVRGLEPSFVYDNAFVRETKATFDRKGLSPYISAKRAVDAVDAVPGGAGSVDVIIVNGVNFQDYASGQNDFVNQFEGLLAALKPNGTLLMSGRKEGQEVVIDFLGDRMHVHTVRFQFSKFLDHIGLSYKPVLSESSDVGMWITNNESSLTRIQPFLSGDSSLVPFIKPIPWKQVISELPKRKIYHS